LFGFLMIQHLQHLPFPLFYNGPSHINKWLEFYFPLVLVVISAVGCLIAVKRPLNRVVISLLPLIFVGCSYLFARTDEFHLAPLSILLPLLLIIVFFSEKNLIVRTVMGLGVTVVILHGLDRVVTTQRQQPTRVALSLKS